MKMKNKRRKECMTAAISGVIKLNIIIIPQKVFNGNVSRIMQKKQIKWFL